MLPFLTQQCTYIFLKNERFQLSIPSLKLPYQWKKCAFNKAYSMCYVYMQNCRRLCNKPVKRKSLSLTKLEVSMAFKKIKVWVSDLTRPFIETRNRIQKLYILIFKELYKCYIPWYVAPEYFFLVVVVFAVWTMSFFR